MPITLDELCAAAAAKNRAVQLERAKIDAKIWKDVEVQFMRVLGLGFRRRGERAGELAKMQKRKLPTYPHSTAWFTYMGLQFVSRVESSYDITGGGGDQRLFEASFYEDGPWSYIWSPGDIGNLLCEDA